MDSRPVSLKIISPLSRIYKLCWIIREEIGIEFIQNVEHRERIRDLRRRDKSSIHSHGEIHFALSQAKIQLDLQKIPETAKALSVFFRVLSAFDERYPCPEDSPVHRSAQCISDALWEIYDLYERAYFVKSVHPDIKSYESHDREWKKLTAWRKYVTRPTAEEKKYLRYHCWSFREQLERFAEYEKTWPYPVENVVTEGDPR